MTRGLPRLALVGALVGTLVGALTGALTGCAATGPAQTTAERVEQVRATETAFARTMADRDLAAFTALIAPDAVFVNSGKPLRGRDAVVAAWRRFFTAPAAPFAWKPEHVEVLAGGDLAYSEGPVWGPDGKVFARYHSTWRRDADGRWRIVFDNGTEVCDCGRR